MFFNRSSEKNRLVLMVRLAPGLIVLMACQSASAVHSHCNLTVDSNCIPKRTTYGYYETNWRRWPSGTVDAFASHPRGTTMDGPDDLPIVETPKISEEGEVRPSSPRSDHGPQATLPGLDAPVDSSSMVPDRLPTEPILTSRSLELPFVPDYRPAMFQRAHTSARRQKPNAAVSGALGAGKAAGTIGTQASLAPLSSLLTHQSTPSDADLVVAVKKTEPRPTEHGSTDRPSSNREADLVPNQTAIIDMPMRELNAPPQVPPNRREDRQRQTIQTVSATRPLFPTNGANPLRSTEKVVTSINPLR